MTDGVPGRIYSASNRRCHRPDIKLCDQKIAKRFYLGPDVAKTKGIILEKPFKLQMTVVAKLSGQTSDIPSLALIGGTL